MYEESKRLDPNRLVSYASNSLQKTPGEDVSGLMDYVMWNEYYESWYKGSPDAVRRNLEEIHAAFPNKPIVISEYGYCACMADRPEGDEHRIRVLETHDAVFRELDYMAGLIFFCYNDYRTHIGDKGTGVCKQRIHGVVDVYGSPKPSWEVLRLESSPINAVHVTGNPVLFTVEVSARAAIPAYRLRGYQLRGIAYGFADIPLEQQMVVLPDITPAQSASAQLKFTTPQPTRIVFDVLRPTGFSTFTTTWRY
jgi:beta-glucuronidase